MGTSLPAPAPVDSTQFAASSILGLSGLRARADDVPLPLGGEELDVDVDHLVHLGARVVPPASGQGGPGATPRDLLPLPVVEETIVDTHPRKIGIERGRLEDNPPRDGITRSRHAVGRVKPALWSVVPPALLAQSQLESASQDIDGNDCGEERTMAATAARGKGAVRGLRIVEDEGDELRTAAPPAPSRGRARDVAIVSVIAVTQLVWMAALAYVVLWLVM